MTEEEQFYYDNLDEHQKETVDLITKELSIRLNKDITFLSNIDIETAKEYLNKQDIFVYKDYASNLNTPYSIWRYVNLYAEEKELCEKIDMFLKTHIDANIYEYDLRKNFSNEVLFKLKNSRNELKVRYIYNSDDDKFSFYLMGHNLHFPVSFELINGLIIASKYQNDKIFDTKLDTCVGIDENTTNNLQNINDSKDTHISLCINGVKITIEKQ